MTNLRIERAEEVYGLRSRTGESRSPFYRKIREGLFTKPVRISGRAVGWPSHEVDALIAARIAGKSDEEIRKLVAQLHAARQGAGEEPDPPRVRAGTNAEAALP